MNTLLTPTHHGLRNVNGSRQIITIDGVVHSVYVGKDDGRTKGQATKAAKRRSKSGSVPIGDVTHPRWANSIFGRAQCDVCDSMKNLTIHHFVPTSKGGSKTKKDNRMVLCRACHDKVHTKLRTSRRKHGDQTHA